MIIVNYNGAALLPRCIRAVRASDIQGSAEVIVVDNGSTDGSTDWLKSENVADKVIVLPKNVGFARANNLGAVSASGTYLLFLNTDCFLQSGTLNAMLLALESEGDVGVVGPKLLNTDQSLQRSCHNFPTPLVFFLEQSNLWKAVTRVPLLKDWLQIAADHTHKRRVDWLVGACMLVRKESFAQVGGFDERFFFYWEEADLCKRLSSAGWSTLFAPEARAIHLGGGSSTDPSLLVQFFRSLYLFGGLHFGPFRRAGLRAVVRLMAVYKAIRAPLGTYRTAGKQTSAAGRQQSEREVWSKIARL